MAWQRGHPGRDVAAELGRLARWTERLMIPKTRRADVADEAGSQANCMTSL